MRFQVLQRFNMVVDLHRCDARYPGDIAADHQYHTKFTHCVRESQDGCGEKARRSQRHRDGKECVDRRGAQGGSDFQRPVPDRLE
jgi:hypothetical protein